MFWRTERTEEIIHEVERSGDERFKETTVGVAILLQMSSRRGEGTFKHHHGPIIERMGQRRR
jgi:hypothetical protein